MDSFETYTKNLLSQLQTYSLVEFYHEEDRVKDKIALLRTGLDDFNIYLPQTKVIL